MPWNGLFHPQAGDVISASDIETYINGNLAWLFNGRAGAKLNYFAGAFTTTSTSFVDVSTANAKLTATVRGGRFYTRWRFPFLMSFSSAGIAVARFRIQADAAINEGDTTYGVALAGSANHTTGEMMEVESNFQGLSDGSHDFRLQWKLTVATGSGWSLSIPSAAASDAPSSQVYAMPIYAEGWEY